MDFSGNKAMVGVVAVLLLLFAASVFFYNRTLNELAAGSCSEDAAVCSHAKVVETQNAVIAVLIIVIAMMAGWLGYNAYFAKPAQPEAPAAKQKRRKIAGDELSPDEQKVAAIINSSGGSVFQSDIMKKTGYTKVKVSRVLDRLEQKGLVERKRRGMANLVVAH